MPLLAGPFGLPRRATILAGFAGALLPVKWRTDTLGDWESVVAAVALIGLSALTVVIWREKRLRWYGARRKPWRSCWRRLPPVIRRCTFWKLPVRDISIRSTG